MKKFIYKIIVFFSPIFFVVFFVRYDIIQNPNNILPHKKQYMDTHAHEIETLILGSSRLYAGLNPIWINNLGHVYNLAYVGRTIEYDFLPLKKYEEQLGKLKNVIIDHNNFTHYNEYESYKWNYYSIFGIVGRHGHSTYFHDVLVPYFVYRKKVIKEYISTFFNEPRQIQHSEIQRYRGWATTDTTIKDKMTTEQGMKHVKLHDHNGENIHLLDSIVLFCKKHKCKLYIITTPCYKNYYQNMDVKKWNNAQKQLNELIKQYPDLPIYCLDLLKDNRFKYEDFYDIDHLNVCGAKKLSNIVDDFVQKTQ